MTTVPCKGAGCSASIAWITTKIGKSMPVDLPAVEMLLKIGAAAGPSPRVTLIGEDGAVLSGQAPDVGQVGTQVRGYRPHWASCPARLAFRKQVRRPEPAV